MFNKDKRYLTQGVNTEVSKEVQLLLWDMIDKLKGEKDYLQVFKLTPKDNTLTIVHTQEYPSYKDTVSLEFKSDFNDTMNVDGSKKIFVVDDGSASCMMLDSEY